MNLVIWLVIGGILGWLANAETATVGTRDTILNVVCGIAGAVVAGLFLSVLLEPGVLRSSELSVGGAVVAPLGAIVVLAVVNLVRLAITT